MRMIRNKAPLPHLILEAMNEVWPLRTTAPKAPDHHDLDQGFSLGQA